MRLRRGLLLLVLAAAAPGQSPEELRDLANEELARNACQLDLPSGEGAGREAGESTPAPGPRPPRPGSRRARPRDDGAGGWSFGGGLGGIAEVLLWMFLAAVAIAFLVAFVRARGAGRAPASAAPRPAAKVLPPAAAETLPDYARLAEQGRFGEAIHALLLAAITRWRETLGAVPAHTTGRELIARAPRARGGAEGLAGLVIAAERVHFGTAAAGRADYDAALANLERWHEACTQR